MGEPYKEGKNIECHKGWKGKPAKTKRQTDRNKEGRYKLHFLFTVICLWNIKLFTFTNEKYDTCICIEHLITHLFYIYPSIYLMYISL